MLEAWTRSYRPYSTRVDALDTNYKATKKLEEANGTAKLEAIASHIAVKLPKEG